VSGPTIFAYVSGNPLMYIDPLGLAGTIPKDFGRGKPLPPPGQLPNETKKTTETNQQTACG
jgi:hypothetical protein